MRAYIRPATVLQLVFSLALLGASATRLEAQAAPAAPPLGTLLKKGTLLHYAMNGKEGPPWHIQSAEVNVPLRGMKGCSHFVIRMNEKLTENRELCRVGKLQLVWDSVASAWHPARPVTPRDSLTIETPDGGSVRYRTGDLDNVTIGGETIAVVPTEVVIFDASGNPQRRLRELYATSLATAVKGTFSVPDLKLQDGWREELAFELLRIVQPK
jgi:hypothetical protein